MDRADRENGASSDGELLRVFLAQRSELVRYTANIVGDRAGAEDIVQEAWLRFNAAAKKQLIGEPRGFLFRIARNLARDGRRRRSFEQKLFSGDDSGVAELIASDEPSAQTRLEAMDELSIIRTAMDALPERTRLAFTMHRFEGARLIDIAERLGISRSLAQELVVDGLERCRKALRRRP
ncbi:sigma-70 family RNA polymerase sigma factor [Novosphingobium aerophilum]|uniref:sigma-70 family RNA polymerase sigma factor n=1 Tax=Novosphingobium aerophilum TaxID=2839843 RepID=UPI003FD38F93